MGDGAGAAPTPGTRGHTGENRGQTHTKKNGHEHGDDVSMMSVVTCPGSRVPRVGSGLSRVDVNVPMCRNYDTLLQNYAHISLCSGTHKLTSQPFIPLGLTHFLAASIFSLLIEIFAA